MKNGIMETRYELTEEGKEYLENGLPEKQLVDMLEKDKSVNFEDAKKIKNFYIALQWALKNKWVKSTGKELILLNYPEKIPEQDALEKVNKGQDIDCLLYTSPSPRD